MKEQIKNIPEKIYLQVGDEPADDFCEMEITWCTDKIYESDIDYVLKNDNSDLIKDIEERIKSNGRDAKIINDYTIACILETEDNFLQSILNKLK